MMGPFKTAAAKISRPSNQHRDKEDTALGRDWGPLDFASDGIVVLNQYGHVTDANAQAIRLLRASLSSLIQSDFWEVVPQEVAENHQAIADKALRRLKESAPYAFVAHNRFEGTTTQYTFRRYQGGFVVNLRDASDMQSVLQSLQDSESRHALVFVANPNPMWIFNTASLQIVAVNQAAAHFYGMPRAEFLKRAMGDLFADGEGSALLMVLNANPNAVDTQLNLQLCKQRKMNGQLVLAELAFGRLAWQGAASVLVSIADVTDRHLADRALRVEVASLQQTRDTLQSQLSSAHRDMAAFTYALSNDLQAPLHAANGFATMLADKYTDALDKPGRHFVSRIQASTRQLARLVDDLRTLVQVPHAKTEIEAVDVATLCAALAAELRKGLKESAPLRLVTVDIDAAMLLKADRSLLSIAVRCLLDNAFKFTSKKAEGWIKLRLYAGKAGSELIFQVSDNGAGFDQHYVDKLFSAFQRLHSAADFPGNGLGLAIVKRVAERHGGRVWAQSEQSGASFFMAFPGGSLKPTGPAAATSGN